MYEKQKLMDHYKNPRNTGAIDGEEEFEGDNPSCGDHTSITVETENGEIKSIKHKTDGCAICTASASLLSNKYSGSAVEEVLSAEKEDVFNSLGTDISPMRVKCAVLPLKTMQTAIESQE